MELRGQINCYKPHLRRFSFTTEFFTINLAAGATPFVSFFGDNNIECYSEHYNLGSPKRANVQHAWYRPTAEAFAKLEPNVQEHVLNGGLTKATLAEAITLQLPNDTVEQSWDYEQFQTFALKTYGQRLPPMEGL